QADVDAGQVVNTATVTGNPPIGSPVTAGPSTVTTTITSALALTVVKTVSGTAPTTVGATITYAIAVKNTGNVTLSAVTVSDANATIASGNPISSIAPNNTVTLTATHTITQADVDAGQVVNTATVTGNPPIGSPVTAGPSTVTTTITSAPALTIVKTVSGTAPTTVGATITYAIAVKNTGNVTLSAVTVSDANA